MTASAKADGGVLPKAHIDIGVEAGDWPDRRALRRIATRAVAAAFAELAPRGQASPELSILFTDDAAIRQLNAQWRGKDKPTNVLSFPAFATGPGDPLPPILGDIVLAAGTVAREAALEGKPLAHHMSHLIVHGLLHLVGYDHETDAEAEAMEGIERRVLARLAIPDPYA